jgi:internalin A
MKRTRLHLPLAQPPLKEDFIYIPNNRTLLRYFQYLYQQFSYANNFGLALDDDDRAGQHGKPVLLSRFFVPPKLSTYHIRPEQLAEAERENKEERIERQRFEYVLNENQWLFLLGDPGSGKSTLLSWLMLELSFSGDNLCKAALGSLVPFALILRDMRLDKVNSWEMLWQRWAEANPVPGKLMADDPDTVKQLFETGQALLCIDGLDEISHQETRRGLGKALLDGLTRFPRCRFIITSRLLGFSQDEFLGRSPVGEQEEVLRIQPTESSIPVYYLAPFDQEQVQFFCRNWHSQYVAQDAEKRGSDLIERLQRNDGLARLARVPVLLNIICFIHARRGRLPDGRAELYQRIAETYLVALDRARGLRFRNRTLGFDFKDLHTWLGKIAYKMQKSRGEAEDAVLIGEKQVAKIIQDGILESGFSSEKAHEETEFILAYIAERSGLFIPRGEKLYAFTHLSFMEYFAAAHLRFEMEFWGKDDEHWTGLRKKMQEPAWKEVFVLLFELMESPRQTEKYLPSLVGNQPDFIANAENLMPIFDLEKQERVEKWPGLYAWAVFAALVMDTAIKMPLAMRQQFIRSLWRCVLNEEIFELFQYQKQFKLVFEPLWSEHFTALDIFQEVAKDKKKLMLAGSNVIHLDPLTHLVHLEELELVGTQVTDFGPLSSLTQLKKLRLSSSPVQDLGPLTHLVHLEELELSWTQVTDLGPLSSLTQLKKLSLLGSPLQDIEPLTHLVHLEELVLRGTQVTDLEPLSSLTQLKNLSIWQSPVEDLEPLTHLVHLEELELDETEVRDLGPLSSLTQLKNLSIWNSPVQDLGPLTHLVHLEELLLYQTEVTDLGPLSSLTQLKKLTIWKSPVQDLGPLTHLVHLEELLLSGTKIKQSKVKELQKVLKNTKINRLNR